MDHAYFEAHTKGWYKITLAHPSARPHTVTRDARHTLSTEHYTILLYFNTFSLFCLVNL